ncbi:hypothetical protein DSO57_1014492 [Entomophthora muscae]|uniref:Uncharacterized protein n=1 Tax=Entomophthora muscae TaxID=34485 RepID=A0ACC2TT38_9FUNG|nr:hypothetical protein DSO57_1014492 [Entomophthora muscae]
MSFYSETFSSIVVGTPLLVIKQTGSVPEYLAAAPEAVTNGHTMLLTLIVNGLKPHICKWVPVGCCTSINDCYKAIIEANNQASMSFHRSNDALPQPCSTPGSAHNGNSGKINCRDVKVRIQNVNMATFRFSLLNSHFYIPTVNFATVAPTIK